MLTFNHTKPSVSVIIPTRKRHHKIVQALRSVLTQTLKKIEVIVVVDGPDKDTIKILGQINDDRLKVKALPQNIGAPLARNAGVNEALSQWVAFLDDDDEWFTQKLEIQLKTAKQSPYLYPIVSCRLIGRSETDDFIWPRKLPTPNEPLSEYLFCRKSPIWGEGLIQTSTIFTKKELLQNVPFRIDTAGHEDLDWLLRANVLKGAGVVFVPVTKPLAIWHIDKSRSRISNRHQWRRSLDWIRLSKNLVTPRAYASFLMTWISTFASQEGDWKAILPLLREAFGQGNPSLIEVLVFGGNWLLPQKMQHRIAALFVKS